MSPPDDVSRPGTRADAADDELILELQEELQRLQEQLEDCRYELTETRQQLALAQEELREAAMGAPGAGIASELRFNETLDLEWRRAIRSEEPISLLIIRLENWQVSPEPSGGDDEIISLGDVGEVLRLSANRPGDLIGHLRDARFGALLPGTDAAGARVVADRILMGLTALDASGMASGTGGLHVCIGCATVAETAYRPTEAIYSMADEALAEAQQHGPDRVVSWASDPAEQL